MILHNQTAPTVRFSHSRARLQAHLLPEHQTPDIEDRCTANNTQFPNHDCTSGKSEGCNLCGILANHFDKKDDKDPWTPWRNAVNDQSLSNTIEAEVSNPDQSEEVS